MRQPDLLKRTLKGRATALNRLEQIVFVDIGGLIIIIAIELVKALRYAAQNRILQSKVYLDEATGLPNKNKCEEILNKPKLLTTGRCCGSLCV